MRRSATDAVARYPKFGCEHNCCRHEFERWTRSKIVRVLQLLKATGHEAWANIVIDAGHVNAWPERGNLCDLVDRVFDDESSSTDKNSVGEDSAHVCDAGDIGPAPLQNVLQPDEEFVGTTNQNGEADNAFLAAQAFREFDALNQDTEEGALMGCNALKAIRHIWNRNACWQLMSLNPRRSY